MTATEETLTLIAGGDIAPVVQPVDRLADKILPILLEADFRFGQCERTYSTRGSYTRWQTESRGSHSRLDPEFATIFKAAHIDVASVASNHSMDFGTEPLLDTIDLFDSWGIKVVGGGRTEEEARRPVIVETNGVKVAILSYCSVVRDGQQAVGSTPGIATLRARTWYEVESSQPGTPPAVHTAPIMEDLHAMEADVRRAREAADAVVVSMHWGLHFVPKTICDYQPVMAHAAIDAGADVIVGHHPHLIKGVEVYRGKAILYSIGNFLTTGNLLEGRPRAMWNLHWWDPYWDKGSLYAFPKDCKHALLPKMTFTRDGVARVALIPVYINRLAQPEPLAHGTALFDEALEYLEWTSEPFPHEFVVEGDEIVVRPDQAS
ncbi:CapA family protein [Acrocarpospora catenulata]|uniref:CapA family protein n=1 Tax=Acrocarpospora catenulata TaxID=2836182 RepID=UPI001BD9C334|nr:CapA family protein [Acrocarpospora catenulata]